jgi:hypothetical protein
MRLFVRLCLKVARKVRAPGRARPLGLYRWRDRAGCAVVALRVTIPGAGDQISTPRSGHWPSIAQGIGRKGQHAIAVSDLAHRRPAMTPDTDMPEIAILPCLMRGESIEDVRLDRWAPTFGPVYALPNDAMARMLSVLNISTAAYVVAVEARYGINLRSSRRQRSEPGPWAWRGDHACGWRAMHVRADRRRPPLLSFDELFEVMENASYGGQFAIAARMSADLIRSTRWDQPLRISGTMQIGIIDYIWGSGHSISHRGDLLIDGSTFRIALANTIGFYTYDSCCDFMLDYFRIDGAAPTTMPDGVRLQRLPAFAQ